MVNELNSINASMQQCMKELKVKKANAEELESRIWKQERLKQDIIEYIEKNYLKSELSQDILAEHFQISTYTLSRIFRHQIGVGFVEYINLKRIEFAKEQLLTTTDSVHIIAERAGFLSDNNFFKVFKNYTGFTPSVFRKMGGRSEDSQVEK